MGKGSLLIECNVKRTQQLFEYMCVNDQWLCIEFQSAFEENFLKKIMPLSVVHESQKRCHLHLQI